MMMLVGQGMSGLTELLTRLNEGVLAPPDLQICPS